MTVAGESARDTIFERVIARAQHTDLDQVTSTLSEWRVEQMLKREYHGRFLLELVQNARDAWDRRFPKSERGRLRIRLARDTSLIIGNEGEFLSEDVVIHSISKVGQTTKPEGSSIGYKGIGFKSVLEMSLTPEIYSRRNPTSEFELRVRYDPDDAVAAVRRGTPGWDQFVAEARNRGLTENEAEHVPLLMFPQWVEVEPTWLAEAAQFEDRSFNTIVRLPYNARFDGRLNLSGREEWLGRVRQAMTEISDEIVLLLGSFERIVLEDELEGTITEIAREAGIQVPLPDDSSMSVGDVTVRRDGLVSSRWLLYRRQLPGSDPDLGREIIVGVRLDDSQGPRRPVASAADPGAAGGCFHLFFPTQIRTYLPFLLHAYFEVDAGRKGFAADARSKNEILLRELVEAATACVFHLAKGVPPQDLSAYVLPALFASTDGQPDDSLARWFRDTLLTRLDKIAWVPARGPGDARTLVAPRQLLVDPNLRLNQLAGEAFRPEYTLGRIDRYLPDRAVAPEGLSFLARRNESSVLSALQDLLRPNALSLWENTEQQIDAGFHALLRLLDAAHGLDPTAAEPLLHGLRGDTRATFIPVLTDAPIDRTLRFPPPLSEPGKEIEGGSILARIRDEGGSRVAPPMTLRISFLPDGIVDEELLSGIASRIGIRPYTTESVIDAIVAGSRAGGGEPQKILEFTWLVLMREALSAFGIKSVAETLAEFNPGAWYWDRPSEYRGEGDLRRQKGLANLRLPANDGSWRAARELAFGNSWADWLGSVDRGNGNIGAKLRLEAYRDLQAICPDDASLVAAPEVFVQLLPPPGQDAADWLGLAEENLPSGVIHRALILALLLRLGVWEIPPLMSEQNTANRSEEERDPWRTLPERSAHLDAVQGGPSEFNWYRHKNIHVADDHRLLWPAVATPAYVRGLARGADFYRQYRRVRLFCPICKNHTTRKLNDGDGSALSLLFYQLGTEQWVPVTVDGEAVAPVRPRDAWRQADVLDHSRVRQGPYRFLPLVERAFSEKLASLMEIHSLEEAGRERLVALLRRLRAEFDSIEKPIVANSEHGASFAQIHRVIYERLSRVAGDADVASIAEDLDVLVTVGSVLRFVAPAAARHNDGKFAPYLALFGTVALVVLWNYQTAVARALGVPALELNSSHAGVEPGTDVTDRVRAIIHERGPELMALLCFYSIGGRETVEVGSRTFRQRASRLSRMRVVQVPSLVVRLEVKGTAIVETVSEREQIFLDQERTDDVIVYHDFAADHWEERFRRALGPHLATLLENDAYADTFQLLLDKADTDREIFLLEKGVGPDQIEQVVRHFRSATEEGGSVSARWWAALAHTLGIERPLADTDELRQVELSAALGAIGLDNAPALSRELIRAGGGLNVRKDVSTSGPLAMLEGAGISLAKLHESLVERGDDGLDVGVAARLLDAWKRQHAREVIAVLVALGRQAHSAKAAPKLWEVASELHYRTRPAPAEYLAPVIATLKAAGAEPDPDALADPAGASAYLANLAGMTLSDLERIYSTLADPAQHAQIERERMAEWRTVLKPIIVASRTAPGEAEFRIHDSAGTVEVELSGASDMAALVAILPSSVPDQQIAEYLIRAVRSHTTLTSPRLDELKEGLRGVFAEAEHLERVIAVLRRVVRRNVEQHRRAVRLLATSNVGLAAIAGSSAPAPAKRSKVERIAITRSPRHHDQETRERLGGDAERWVVADVVRRLMAMEIGERSSAVEQLVTALTDGFDGEIVEKLVSRGREAATPGVEDDDAIDALQAFVQVSRESDQFGFDVLGWVSLSAESTASAAFLEVKGTDETRAFKATRPEWDRAERFGDSYAFCVVVRTPGGVPSVMEVLSNPVERLARGELRRREEDWTISYRPIGAATGAGSG